MPVVFTLFFAMAFGGLSGPASTAPPTVHIENRDADDPLSRAFVEQLRSSNALTVLPGADPEGGAAATLTLPSGFGGALSGGGDAAYELSVRADPAAESRVRGAVDAALSRVASAVATGTIVAGAERELRAPAIEGALQAWRTPPVRVQGSEAAAGAAAAASPATLSPFAQASAGMIVQFAVYGLILSATLLVLERRSGTLQRLAATRLSRASVLGGHLLAMFTVVLAQTLLLLAFGQLALGVPYARAPLAVLVVATALAAWSAALGFLLGCLARTEEQVVMGALVAMFVFSALGGAWFPLEVTRRHLLRGRARDADGVGDGRLQRHPRTRPRRGCRAGAGRHPHGVRRVVLRAGLVALRSAPVISPPPARYRRPSQRTG